MVVLETLDASLIGENRTHLFCQHLRCTVGEIKWQRGTLK